MALPVIQTTTVQQFASSHPWSVTKPSGVTAGDLLLVILASAAATWTPPAGWNTGPTATPGVRQVSSFWRIADGSEGASFNFDSGSNLVGCSVCLRISGAHQTSPINGSSSGVTAFGGANPTTVGSITTTVNDCLLLTGWSWSSSVSRSLTPPAGASQVADQNSASPQEEVWAENLGAAGATGTRDWSLSTTSADRTALSLAIAPPSTNPTTGQLWPHGKKGTPPTTGQTFPRGVTL